MKERDGRSHKPLLRKEFSHKTILETLKRRFNKTYKKMLPQKNWNDLTQVIYCWYSVKTDWLSLKFYDG